jgi:hypothetical protein
LFLKRTRGYVHYNNLSKAARLDVLEEALNKSFEEFENDKSFLLTGTMDDGKAAYRDVVISLTCRPSTLFALHVGRLLGYPSMPASDSWKHAGDSYNFRMFCTVLWMDMSPTSEQLEIEEGGTVLETAETSENEPLADSVDAIGNPAVVDTWVGGTKYATYLRVCFYRECVEAHLADPTKAYSEGSALMQYLPQALLEYNRQRLRWDLPAIPADKFLEDIRKTAQETWLHRVTDKSRIPSTNAPPSGDWLTAINDKTERVRWEQYYCILLRNWRVRIPATAGKRAANHGTGTSDSALARREKKAKLSEDSSAAKVNEGPAPQASNQASEDDQIQDLIAAAAADRDALMAESASNRAAATAESFTTHALLKQMINAVTDLTQAFRAAIPAQTPMSSSMTLATRGPSPTMLYSPSPYIQQDLVVVRQHQHM